MDAISFENMARSYVGIVQTLTIQTSVSTNDVFWCEPSGMDVKHVACFSDDNSGADTYSTLTMPCYLLRQQQSTTVAV
jgi:hypothetical protein